MGSVFLSSKLSGAVWIALALVTLQASWSSAEDDVTRPTLHELAAIEARGGPRLWYHEEEFRRHPRLRAEPHQVVVLHLEPAHRDRKPTHNALSDHWESARQRSKRIRNVIPYRFAEPASYTFCVPKDEPHIRSIELRREGWHSVEVHVTRNSPCKTRTIAGGRYQLQVVHDGSELGAAGKKAFLHVPRAQSSSFPPCSDAGTSPFEIPQVLFAAPNGSYVVEDDASHKLVTSTTLQDYWFICHDDGGNYQILQPIGGPPRVFFSSGPPSTDTTLYSRQEGPDIAPTAFKLTDLGGGQFTLAANFAGTLYPIVLGADGALHWTTSGTPTTFAIVLTYYPPEVAAQPVQPGETALFQACNYLSSKGTWVFNTNISDFQPFTVLSGSFSLDNTVASAKVGPQTVATLYANPNFGGTSQVIGADTPCLDGTPLGSNAASSLKIEPARQFVASTGSCQYCNLTGVDLSNLDLTGGSFQGSTFTGANLTNTNLQSAILDQTKFRSYSAEGGSTTLNGTDFLGAHLRCTDFQASDLRQAFFVSSGTPPVLPVIAKDFSCRLQLQHTALNLNTFPVSDWRYFNLNDAAISGASGQVLSTATQPLDLSKAQLSGTTGLAQVDLTAANIAGADFSRTDLTGANLSKVTSIDPLTQQNAPAAFTNAKLVGAKFDYATLDGAQLTDASLSNASLIRVSLKDAVLQGALLDSTNLDGANLGGAKLNLSPNTSISANLEGAFLRNVNLSGGADLTGVSLKNSNFYSSSPTSSSTCNPDSSGFTGTCASASGAQLDNAKFWDAYLAGVDFSGAFAQAASFDGAFLMGSNFSEADLTVDSSTGTPVTFEQAYLQGANFSNANVTGANFKDAVVDLTNTNGQTLRIQLDLTTHPLAFPGYTPHAGSDLGCVQFSTARKTTLPSPSYSISMCPDGKQPDGTAGSSCSQNQWTAVPLPVSSSCNRDSNWTSTSGIY